MIHHPIQPLQKGADGVLRFRANPLVQHLLEVGKAHGCGLNELAIHPAATADDHQQLAQLIGYSLSGYGELSYVDKHSYDAAAVMGNADLNEDKCRIQLLEMQLKDLREQLAEPMARLFGLHPDDLKGPEQ